MLYAGIDLSRKRLDVHVLREDGSTALVTAVSPDSDALRTLVRRVAIEGDRVRAAIESMNGARFVHDALEFAGWDVLIADAQRVRGLAPLAAKTDKIDARVLAELTRRALVPEIWLPTPEVRAERERARFRLHLVRHRSALKNRIHATLIAFGYSRPMADLFGVAGRELLDSLHLPEPWQSNLLASLELMDDLTARADDLELELKRLGAHHPLMRC
jgi:transposase